jgi:hypothetical protein
MFDSLNVGNSVVNSAAFVSVPAPGINEAMKSRMRRSAVNTVPAFFLFFIVSRQGASVVFFILIVLSSCRPVDSRPDRLLSGLYHICIRLKSSHGRTPRFSLFAAVSVKRFTPPVGPKNGLKAGKIRKKVQKSTILFYNIVL